MHTVYDVYIVCNADNLHNVFNVVYKRLMALLYVSVNQKWAKRKRPALRASEEPWDSSQKLLKIPGLVALRAGCRPRRLSAWQAVVVHAVLRLLVREQ